MFDCQRLHIFLQWSVKILSLSYHQRPQVQNHQLPKLHRIGGWRGNELPHELGWWSLTNQDLFWVILGHCQYMATLYMAQCGFRTNRTTGRRFAATFLRQAIQVPKHINHGASLKGQWDDKARNFWPRGPRWWKKWLTEKGVATR